MTDSIGPQTGLEREGCEYVGVWAQGMAQALGEITHSAFAMESPPEAPPEAPGADTGDLHFLIAATGSLRGEMNLRLPRPSAVALGQLLMGEPRDAAAELKAGHSDATQKLLRKVAGEVAAALRPRWGEVQLRVESGAPPSWPPGGVGWLCSAAQAAFPVMMECQLSAALLAALRTPRAPAMDPSTSVSGPADTRHTKDKLHLLIDVELDVAVRFGSRRMLLREILELSSGSVVELDRQLQEPADLLLDGKLIARGEVVIVDGNYGMRVTEIVAS